MRKMYVDPVKDFRKIKGEVAGQLYFYANLFSNPGSASSEDLTIASESLRKLGADLNSCVQQLPRWKIIRTLFELPSEIEIKEAITPITGLSNGVFKTTEHGMFILADKNKERVEKVKELLRIR